ILIIMLKLVNNREVMGDYVNSKMMNVVTWITIGVLIVLTVMLLATSIFYRY
ncbi:MAG TPA: Mn transporter, partial [Nitrospiraceae bacterium]|nr:Mn transporter [Nitrospiraceae bacterium]